MSEASVSRAFKAGWSFRIACGLSLGAWLPTALAAPAALQCASTKLMVSGMYAMHTLQCESAGIRRGVPAALTCLQKADQRFSDSFQRLDARGGCFVTGDAASLVPLVDALVTPALAALNPGLASTAERKCAATKVNTVAVAAQRRLKCYTNATRFSTALDSECLSRAEASSTAMFVRLDSSGQCATTGDAAAMHALVVDFVDAVVAVIPTTQPTATPTPTPTVSGTATPTSCRGDLPAVNSVTSPTDQPSQVLYVCGRNVGSSSLTVTGSAGPATSLGLSGGCSETCPNPANAACYAFALPLLENTVNAVSVCQANGSCVAGGCVTTDRNGYSLAITQSP